MAAGNADNIIRKEHLKKLKTGKKKLFVLRDKTKEQPACLEYYDSQKKFITGCPKKTIVLKKCFSITKKAHSHAPHAIVLYLPNESLGMVMESEQQQEEWYEALLALQDYMQVGKDYKQNYEYVWDVRVVSSSVIKKPVTCGPYWLCLGDHTMWLLQITSHEYSEPLQFPLVFIRCIRKRGEKFEVTLGRHAVTGEGELSMQTEDENAAQQMHDIVLKKMNAGKEGNQTRQRTRSITTPDGPKKRPNSAGTGSRTHSESIMTRARTISEGRHVSHSPPTNELLNQRSMDSYGSSLSMESGEMLSGTPTDRMEGHGFMPDPVPEEDYMNMNGEDQSELRSPMNYHNLIPKSASRMSGSCHGSYGSHVGSEVLELTSPIGSTPPDLPMSPETLGDHGIRGKLPPGTPSSRSSVAGSVSHSRTSSFNDEYMQMNPLDNMSPLTNTIPKLKECMSDDSYMEASPGSSCSLTSGTPSMEIRLSDFPLEKVQAYLCTDDEDYLLERSNRCYSVGSKPEHLRKQPRIEAISIAKSAPSSRLRAFSVGSRNSGKGQDGNRSGDRSPSTSSLAVVSGSAPLSSSWSGPNEKGSFLKNFFKKSEHKSSNLMEVDHGNFRKSSESIGSDKFRGSTDSLRKRPSCRPRSNTTGRPTNLNPPRKLSVESLNSGRGKSPVKEEFLFGEESEGYMEIQPGHSRMQPVKPKLFEQDSGYVTMSMPGNDDYLAMGPGHEQRTDDYVPMNPHDDYLSMNPGQRSDDYLPMNPSTSTKSDDYVPMDPSPNSSYMMMSPTESPKDDYLDMSMGPQRKYSLDNNIEKKKAGLERVGSLCSRRDHLAIPLSSENRDVLKPLGLSFRMKSPSTPDSSPIVKHSQKNSGSYMPLNQSRSDEYLNMNPTSQRNGPTFNSLDSSFKNGRGSEKRFRKHPDNLGGSGSRLDYLPTANEDAGEYVEVKGKSQPKQIQCDYMNMDAAAKRAKPTASPFSSWSRKDLIPGRISGSFNSLPHSPHTSTPSNSPFSSLPRSMKSHRSNDSTSVFKTHSPEMDRPKKFQSHGISDLFQSKKSPDGSRSKGSSGSLNLDATVVSPRYEESDMCPIDNSNGEMKIVDIETVKEDERRKSEAIRTCINQNKGSLKGKKEEHKSNVESGLRRSESVEGGKCSKNLACFPAPSGSCVPIPVAKKVSLTTKDSSQEDSLLKRVVSPSSSLSLLTKVSPKRSVKQKEKSEGAKESAFRFGSSHRIEKQMSVPNQSNTKPPVTSSYSSPSSVKTSPTSGVGFFTEPVSLEGSLLEKLASADGTAKDDEDEGRCMHYIELDHSESNENVLSRGATGLKSRNPSGASIAKDGGLTYSVIDFTKSEELKGTTTLSISRHS